MSQRNGIDTNIVVRFLTGDDERQPSIARRVVADGVYITISVLLESAWVLQSAMSFHKQDIIEAFVQLSEIETVEFENEPQVRLALEAASSGLDLADALHLAANSDCARFFTFDKALVRRAKNSKVLHPEQRF